LTWLGSSGFSGAASWTPSDAADTLAEEPAARNSSALAADACEASLSLSVESAFCFFSFFFLSFLLFASRLRCSASGCAASAFSSPSSTSAANGLSAMVVSSSASPALISSSPSSASPAAPPTPSRAPNPSVATAGESSPSSDPLSLPVPSFSACMVCLGVLTDAIDIICNIYYIAAHTRVET